MNATEARELAEKNRDKIAESKLQEAITAMEKEIDNNAKNGLFGAAIKVDVIVQWKEFSCTDSFVDYFSNLGFEVETIGIIGGVARLVCRW